MAAHLTEEEIDKIRRQFLILDKDGNGELSFEELNDILKDPELKMSRQDVKNLLHEFDYDLDGTIDVHEFLLLMAKKKNQKLIHRAIVLRTRIRRTFNELDRDGNGYISKEEFKGVMRKQGLPLKKSQLNAIMAEADKNGDGKIDYDEFVIFMTK